MCARKENDMTHGKPSVRTCSIHTHKVECALGVLEVVRKGDKETVNGWET